MGKLSVTNNIGAVSGALTLREPEDGHGEIGPGVSEAMGRAKDPVGGLMFQHLTYVRLLG